LKTNFFVAIFSLALVSCNLEREIEVKIPPYKKELVAECYLERGKPIKVFLSETDPYFDTLRFPTQDFAQIVVKAGTQTDTVPFFPQLDFVARKYYNYATPEPGFPLDTNQVFEMIITDSLGRTLTGTTRFLPLPRLDSIQVQYQENPDESFSARTIAWIHDFPDQDNYYRIIMNEDSLNGPPAVEFTFTDQFSNGVSIPLGTGYRFKPGQVLFFRVYHIEKQYYDYLESLGDAARANGNPFAQPATVKSPMKGGGYGIFTTLNYVQVKKEL